MSYVSDTIGGISEKISTGKTPPTKEVKYFDKDIKWFTPGDFNGITLINSRRFISHLAIEEKKANLFGKGTVLLSCIGEIGKVGVVSSNASCNQQITSIKLKEIVDPFFFAYWCRANKKLIESKASNAVVPILNNATLSRIKIIYPEDLLEQKRIAHLLGKVENLINERKQNLKQLDELLKSVFLDRFGDPVRNEKEWEIRPCNQVVINIQSGTSFGGEEKLKLNADELGVLKISAVTKGYLNPKEFKAVKKSVIKKPLRFIEKGDLLFSRANTVELVAACCVVEFDSDTLFLPDKLWALTLEKDINIQYFNHLLKNENFRNTVRKKASGGHDSMLNISMKKFLSLSIPVPKKELQDAFSLITEKIEKIKHQYQISLSGLEELYNALSQKAFKGELDLSHINLADEAIEPSSFDKLQKSIEVTDRLHPKTPPFDKLQQAMEAIESLVPEPIRRYNETINKVINQTLLPSVQRTQQELKALHPIPENIHKMIKVVPELPGIQIAPFSHLDLFGFNDPKARPQILEHWFNEWLADSPVDYLNVDHFWQRAQRSLVDYLYEEDLEEFEFSMEDYDTVKKLLFKAIDNGLIKQTTDTVQLNSESVAGNRVILIKG